MEQAHLIIAALCDTVACFLFYKNGTKRYDGPLIIAGLVVLLIGYVFDAWLSLLITVVCLAVFLFSLPPNPFYPKEEQ